MQKRPFIITSLVILALTLTACGPTSKTVEVRLRTGLESKHNFKNMMNGLVNASFPAFPAIIGTCEQRHVFAVVSPNDQPGSDVFDTYPIPLISGYEGAGYTIDSLWVAANATFPPISIPVPRGIPVGVGIIGSLPASEEKVIGTNFCALKPNFGGNPHYIPTSLIGHRRITANSPQDVELKVWVNPIYVSPAATPNPGGDPNCALPGDSNQNCPSQDFAILECDFCSGFQRILRLEYGMGRNQPRQVVQWINQALVATTLHIPNITPMKVTVVDSITLADKGTITFNQTSFSQPPGDRIATHTFPFGAVSPSGPITLSMKQRSPTFVPVIAPVTLTPFNGNGISSNTVNVLFTNAANATGYRIQAAVAPSGAYTTVATVNSGPSVINTLTAPLTYNVRIEAFNNLGSVPYVTSPQFYQPLGPMSPPVATSITAGQATLTWTPPAGADATLVYTIDKCDPAGNVLGPCPGATFPSSTINCTATSFMTFTFRINGANSTGGKVISSLSNPITIL